MTEAKCRWVASDQPRVMSGRHLDDCRDEGCRGCRPCGLAHCRDCGVEHSVGACPGCVGSTRETLWAIVELYDGLWGEAATKGVSSEAMNLIGPAADPEAWGHVTASLQSGRIPDDWRLLPADSKGIDDQRHPLFVLGSWEMVYRDAFEQPEARPITISRAARYLDEQLTAAANEPWVAFEQMAKELRECRTHLEAVLHDGEQVERGAPCPQCRKPLTLAYGQRVIDDRWRCQNRRCDVGEYTTTQYRGWVEDDAIHQADRLTAADMARRFRDEDDRPLVKAGEVRVWGSREKVKKRGRDGQGMTLYDVRDVAALVEARINDSDCV